MLVLVTRPLKDAARSKSRLEALGHQVHIAPALRITGVVGAVSADEFDASLVTSSNAVSFMDTAMRAVVAEKPIFAVGAQTAAWARAAGLTNVVSAHGDRFALLATIRENMPRGAKLLYLAGRQRKGDLEQSLASVGYVLQTIAIYESVPVKEYDQATRDLLAMRGVDAVLHYSRMSALAFLKILDTEGLHNEFLALKHYCLSEDVAEPLRAAGAKSVIVAAQPDEGSLFFALGPIEGRPSPSKAVPDSRVFPYKECIGKRGSDE